MWCCAVPALRPGGARSLRRSAVWEVWDQIGDAVVCPDCITTDELTAMVQGDMLEVREAEANGYLFDEEVDALGGSSNWPCRLRRPDDVLPRYRAVVIRSLESGQVPRAQLGYASFGSSPSS
jgi:hypothetical protein